PVDGSASSGSTTSTPLTCTRMSPSAGSVSWRERTPPSSASSSVGRNPAACGTPPSRLSTLPDCCSSPPPPKGAAPTLQVASSNPVSVQTFESSGDRSVKVPQSRAHSDPGAITSSGSAATSSSAAESSSAGAVRSWGGTAVASHVVAEASASASADSSGASAVSGAYCEGRSGASVDSGASCEDCSGAAGSSVAAD